jgi:hypothetical protein
VFGESIAPPRPFTLNALGLFFELSMGLSAQKEFPGMIWYLVWGRGATWIGISRAVPKACGGNRRLGFWKMHRDESA